MSQVNVKTLCTTAVDYADAHDGKLPPADSYPQALAEYMGRAPKLRDPGAKDAERSYAMNASLDAANLFGLGDIGRTVLFFECRAGAPCAGGPDDLPDKPRYRGGYVIGFVDGHVVQVAPEEVDDLIWTLDD